MIASTSIRDIILTRRSSPRRGIELYRVRFPRFSTVSGPETAVHRRVGRESMLQCWFEAVGIGTGPRCRLMRSRRRVMPALAVSAGGSATKALIEYRPFAPPEPARTIGLVWRRRSPSNPALRAVADALRVHAPDEVSAVASATRIASRREPAEKPFTHGVSVARPTPRRRAVRVRRGTPSGS
jgi:DNA-binding transcriptional LysR family regulator